MEKIGGRKFVLAIIAILLGGVLLYVDKITAEMFMQLVMVNLGVYGVGNVAAKFAIKK